VVDRNAHEVSGLLFETSSEAVFVVDRTTQRIASANLRACEMLHCNVDSLIGVSLGELVFEADRDLASAGHYEEVALKLEDIPTKDPS
jgi:PAS domain-containing protein